MHQHYLSHFSYYDGTTSTVSDYSGANTSTVIVAPTPTATSIHNNNVYSKQNTPPAKQMKTFRQRLGAIIYTRTGFTLGLDKSSLKYILRNSDNGSIAAWSVLYRLLYLRRWCPYRYNRLNSP